MKAVDDNKSVILLLHELSAAFDSVDPTILVSRLGNRFGIRDTVLNWFRSKQFVSVNGIDRQQKICSIEFRKDLCLVLYCIHFTQVHWVI